MKIYAHGKLLITGEYLILDGAKGLAIPTTFGQQFEVSESTENNNILYWQAKDWKGNTWLNLTFDKQTLSCMNSKEKEAEMLEKILAQCRALNPTFLKDSKTNTAVHTRLEFPNEWGLGTSSTLIYSVAYWAKVDPYELLKQTFGGSGYDIACAATDVPIEFQLVNGKPIVKVADFSSPCWQHVYFVYTGSKQNSREAIKHYRETNVNRETVINELNNITDSLLLSKDLNKFENLLNQHETIIASHLHLPKVKDTLFPDYWGAVKSLGAWGGDFVLLVNNRSTEDLYIYLKEKELKGYSFKTMLLKL